jgi:uncharacterized protein (DUF433 family)
VESASGSSATHQLSTMPTMVFFSVPTLTPSFTSEQVMRLTGLSRRRLNYWLDHGVISAEIDKARGRGHVRVWSFANLVEIRCAIWLREQISLQLLRAVVRKLRSGGLDTPLAEVRVGVIAPTSRHPKVVVQGQDGKWAEALSGQLVMMELLLPVGQFRSELDKAIVRDRRQRRAPGKIESRRGALGSTKVFAGTRIPVAAVQRLHEAGWDTKRIVEEYPGLTRRDIQVALSLEAG